MEASWATVGKDCICIRERWLRRVQGLGILSLFADIVEEKPGPKFMQQYKIAVVDFEDREDAGHRVKLGFVEYPGEWYCVCGFRPLETIKDEERKDTTAPVDLEKV